ncbi:SpoIIIAC/SpoIIIAD family protein [Porcipelethomonas sp.]|uniref:SpoIIIAC/SpoIIIAD family protein n=1 Tax=Porcipelethomonas sp. TaxID=2981675 RepID=UPI003EF68711
MVTGIVSICGLCICASLICKITEKYSKEQAVLLVIAVCTFIFMAVLSGIPDIAAKLDELTGRLQIDSEYITILFKALGICYITQFSADICRDCNETAIASAVEILGKIQLIVLALPLFEQLIDVIMVIME